MNVLPLSKTHHGAFDREVFTLDQDYRLRINPSLETQSDVLQRATIKNAGEREALPDWSVDPDYVSQQNAAIEWG